MVRTSECCSTAQRSHSRIELVRGEIPTFLLAKLNEIFEDKTELFKTVFRIAEWVSTDEMPLPQICLYGEGYGARIQKGGGNYIKDGVDIVLFDIKIGHWWLKQVDVKEIADELGLYCVPRIYSGTIEHALQMVKKGVTSVWGDFEAEGLVLRPVVDLKARSGERIIAKVKHTDFV